MCPEEALTRPLEHEAGEAIRDVGAGIDVDPVVVDLGPADWRVRVDDDLAEAVLALQKLFPDPHQILSALQRQRHSGPDAGVAKEVIPRRSRQPQVLEEREVVRWELCPEAARGF